jgi:hypothetical protein
VKRWFCVLVVVLLFAIVGPVGAKGAVDKVTLVGPHWYGEVEITDPDLLEYLSLGEFADFERELERPPLVSVGYLMTRYFEYEGEMQPLDRVMYFPGAEPGEGVVYYIEMNDANGPYDGSWFRVRPESEEALLAWLSKEGIIPYSTEFESPEIGSPGTDQALLLGGGMLLVGLMGGVALGRRGRP